MSLFVGPKMFQKEISQTLVEAKRLSRGVDNTVSSLVPLAQDADTEEKLRRVVALSIEITDILSGIYNTIAREAFSE